jgi:hypothetical protein
MDFNYNKKVMANEALSDIIDLYKEQLRYGYISYEDEVYFKKTSTSMQVIVLFYNNSEDYNFLMNLEPDEYSKFMTLNYHDFVDYVSFMKKLSKLQISKDFDFFSKIYNLTNFKFKI